MTSKRYHISQAFVQTLAAWTGICKNLRLRARAPGDVEPRTPELLELGGLGHHSHGAKETQEVAARAEALSLLPSVVSEPSLCHQDVWMSGECCVHGLQEALMPVVGNAAQLDTVPGHGLGAERGIFVLLHFVPGVRPREARTTH